MTSVYGQVMFSSAEHSRVLDLLGGLGCIGNPRCVFSDFASNTVCNRKGTDYAIMCNFTGFLTEL
jgi:hypothetical protein